MPANRYWDIEVAEARELIEHSKGVDYAFVGVLRAKAIVAVDQELRELREKTRESRRDGGQSIQNSDDPG